MTSYCSWSHSICLASHCPASAAQRQNQPALTAGRSAAVKATTLVPTRVRARRQQLRCCLALRSCNFADLGSSLTSLQLWDDRDLALRIAHPTLPPQLHQLSSLEWLRLKECSLLPDVLCSMTQLTLLHLSEGVLLPVAPDGWSSSAESTAAFLSALQRLTQLQHLHLEDIMADTRAPALQQWSALTASSQLTYLLLYEKEARPLPPGAAQRFFTAQLPHLQTLSLGTSSQLRFGWCLDGQDLQSIIACCPNLTSLDLQGVVRSGADMAVLSHLPASCCSLEVGGTAVTDAAAAALSQLPQLTYLSLTKSRQLTCLGVQQLTALQAIRRLYISECAGVRSICVAAGSTDLDLKLSWGEAEVGALSVLSYISLKCPVRSKLQGDIVQTHPVCLMEHQAQPGMC